MDDFIKKSIIFYESLDRYDKIKIRSEIRKIKKFLILKYIIF